MKQRLLTQPEQYVLETPLSPEECIVRLRAKIHSRRDTPVVRQSAWASKPLTGWAKKDRFSLRLRKKWKPYGSGDDPYRTTAVGQFMPVDAGTRIEVRLGLHHSQAFQLAYASLGFLIFIALAVAIMWQVAIHHAWWIVIIVALLASLSMRGWRQGWQQGRSDTLEHRDHLITMLCEILGADARRQ